MRGLLLILALSPALGFCQYKEKITGIGLFKLGQTKEVILDSLVEITNAPIQQCEEIFDAFLHPKPNVIHCNNNTNCPYEDVYMMYSISIAGMELNKITFKFFNDTLYSFECESPGALSEALDIKYGEAPLETETKTITCINQYNGAHIDHQEETFTKHWRKDATIHCWHTTGCYYDDDCKKNLYSMFYLINIMTEKRENNCWMQARENKKKEKLKLLDKL